MTEKHESEDHMKSIVLQSLSLKNFKGITTFDITIPPTGINIAGGNETGKTTLFDAFCWVLFGKDSQGKSDFQLKPTDDQGQERNKIDVEVEVSLIVDEQEIVLLRRYKEKWTKKKGEARKTFTGHVSEFTIDGVPAKKKEFEEKVDGIISVDLFKKLTDPSQFPMMHWEKQRELLFDICGDFSDQDVIESKTNLKELTGLLNGKTVEDYRKVLRSKKAAINKQIESIPIRIDELNSSMSDVKPVNQVEIKMVTESLDNERLALSKIKSNELLAVRNQELAEVKQEIVVMKTKSLEQMNQERAKPSLELSDLNKQRQDLDITLNTLKSKVMEIDSEIQRTKNKITDKESRLKTLRDEWATINAREQKIEDVCPCCGQFLPDDKVEEALSQFNLQKSKDLEANQVAGKSEKAKLDGLVSAIEQHQKDKTEIESKINEVSGQIKSVDEDVQVVSRRFEDIKPTTDTKAMKALEDQEKAIVEDIKNLTSDNAVHVEKCKEKIIELERQLTALQEQEALHKTTITTKDRIQELEGEEKSLSESFEDIERQLYLIELFTVSKVDLVEKSINQRFKHARFKLFKELINGGIEPCCEVTYKGIPYNRGLNNAAKINVGLDIINTLQLHNRVIAPVFIDNAESVNELIDMACQVITLSVSTDKQLTIME